MAVAASWVMMVLVLGADGSPALKPVPGYYLSEASCERAAKVARSKFRDNRPVADCLPVDANP